MYPSLLLLLSLLCTAPSHAQQSLAFQYDPVGNQIRRQWQNPSQKPSPTDGQFRIQPQRVAQITRIRVLLPSGQVLYDQNLSQIPIDLSQNQLFYSTTLAVVSLSLKDGHALS